MAFDQNGPRLGQARYLTATAYRYATACGFTVWGALLIIFVYSRSLTAWVGRNDLLQLLQASTALAAVILAILALLEQLGSRDRYLKMALSGLLICFVAATVASLLSALANPQETGLQNVEFRLVFLGGLYLSVGSSEIVVVSLDRLKAKLDPNTMPPHAVWRHQSVFELLRSLPRHVEYWVRSLRLSGTLDVLDYSSTVLPIFAFALWSKTLFLAAAAVALSVGGAVLLLFATIAMFIVVWRSRTREEQLRPRVLEILRQARERHQNGQMPAPVTLEYLRDQTRSNDENLQEALEELYRTDAIARIDFHSYYILNELDWDRCKRVIRETEIIEWPKYSRDADYWNKICRGISEEIRLPDEAVKKFMLETIKEEMETRVNRDMSKLGDSWSDAHGEWGMEDRMKSSGISSQNIEKAFKCLPRALSDRTKRDLAKLVSA